MRRLIAVLAGAALFAGACGGDSPSPTEDPKAAFSSAVESLGQKDALSVTLSIQSTAESLTALSEGELKPEDAQKIIDSSFTVSGTQGDDPGSGTAQIVLNLAGTDAFEMRVLGYDIYARADIPAIAETFGQDAAQLDPLGEEAAAGGFGFVKDALDGKWLALKNLDEVAQGFGVPIQQGGTEQQQIIEEFTNSLKNSATVTPQGEDEYGAHLLATFPIRQLAQDFIDLSQRVGPGIPGAELPDVNEIPDETIDVDVWIKDGVLTQLEFDFVQLAKFAPEEEEIPEGVDRIALRIAIAEFTGTVEVPEGAVEVDPQAIMSAVMGVGGMGGMPSGDMSGGGGGGGAPSGDFPCEMLEGEPKAVLRQFKKECPHLQ